MKIIETFYLRESQSIRIPQCSKVVVCALPCFDAGVVPYIVDIGDIVSVGNTYPIGSAVVAVNTSVLDFSEPLEEQNIIVKYAAIATTMFANPNQSFNIKITCLG